MLENKAEKGNLIVQSADNEDGSRTFINSYMNFVIRPKQIVYFLSDGKDWYTQS